MPARVKAYILAVGEFSGAVMPHMEHPADRYEELKDGELVTTRLFRCLTWDQAAGLAKAFGVDPARAPSQHLSPLRIRNLPWLEETFHFCGSLSDFQFLRKRGFTFFLVRDRRSDDQDQGR